MNEKDPFEILGIHENAQHEDIQLAYESRCMQYHPDRYVGQDEKTRAWAAAKMQEVEAAYQQVILLGAFVKFCEHALSDNIPPPPLRAPLASFAHGREYSHHRVHPHSPASATEKKDAASILLNSGWDSSCERIYARPNIPRKKLAGAIAAYAPNVLPDEVIILLDDTVFGGAREGLLVTQNDIYCKELGGEPGHWRLDAIQTMKPGADARVMINGRKFFKAVLIDHFAVAAFVSRLSSLFE